MLRRLQRVKASVRARVVESVCNERRESAEVVLRSFSDAGDRFVQEAEAFDPALRPDEIFQALRNLWIVNSLQAAFALPVRMNPSAFAYSLMYPYTDNYLDDPSIPAGRKEEFNSLLFRRLRGLSDGESWGPLEKLAGLLALVEREYPRRDFPEVYASLTAIHRAQERSLLQQKGGHTSHDEILAFSLEKGGTSVLADGFLAKGRLAPREAWFAFRFGVALQFIDDLQDAECDARRGHHTLFTLAAEHGTLDALTNRLLRFQQRALSSRALSQAPEGGSLLELMRSGCRSLVLESVALHPHHFSKSFVGSMERYSPLRFGYIRELEDRMHARKDRLREAFKRMDRRGGQRTAALAAS